MTNEVFDPASARAIEEAAKFGSKAIDAGTGLAAYLDRVLGRLPDNVVGFLSDWIEHTRIRRAAELWKETKKHLHRLGVNRPADVSPSVLVPLLDAALSLRALRECDYVGNDRLRFVAVKVGELEWLMVDENQHALFRREKRFEARIRGLWHHFSSPRMATSQAGNEALVRGFVFPEIALVFLPPLLERAMRYPHGRRLNSDDRVSTAPAEQKRQNQSQSRERQQPRLVFG